MALLKHIWKSENSLHVWCFHDWIIMALLKLRFLCGFHFCSSCFHDWIIMALLKRLLCGMQLGLIPTFPWLNNHGSIEARSSSHCYSWSHLCFHDWIIMALLKLTTIGLLTIISMLFPWLNNHGSIEAESLQKCRTFRDVVSMIE